MRRVYLIGLLLLLTLGITTVVHATGGAPRVATMSGANEIAGGDPDGTGSASITLNAGQATVCWELSVSNIAPATAAHIHAAPAGVNGPVVVPLSPPTTGTSSGCKANVDPALIQNIIDHPELYYVNVHNAEFPGGAIRGQLSNRGKNH